MKASMHGIAVVAVVLSFGLGVHAFRGGQRSTDGQLTVADIYRASIPHVFTIHAGELYGTGFTFLPRGNYIVTNAHVVAKASDVQIETQDGVTFNATVASKNVDLDWALLKPTEIAPFLSMLPLPTGETPAIGEPIVVIGSPGGLKGTVTSGIVSQILPDGMIQLNVAINPGNSGGPVFNMKGEVFGIATSKYNGGDGLGFAIPLSRINRTD